MKLLGRIVLSPLLLVTVAAKIVPPAAKLSACGLRLAGKVVTWDRVVAVLKLLRVVTVFVARMVPVLVKLLRMAFGLAKMVRECGVRQASLILSEAGMAALGHVAQGLEGKIRAHIA